MVQEENAITLTEEEIETLINAATSAIFWAWKEKICMHTYEDPVQTIRKKVENVLTEFYGIENEELVKLVVKATGACLSYTPVSPDGCQRCGSIAKP